MLSSQIRMAGPGIRNPNPNLELIQNFHSIDRIPGRHVGKNDRVTHVQAFHDLNLIYGATTQPDLSANRFSGWSHLENSDRAVLLTVRRSADLQYIFQFRNLNGPIDAQIGPRAAG